MGIATLGVQLLLRWMRIVSISIALYRYVCPPPYALVRVDARTWMEIAEWWGILLSTLELSPTGPTVTR